MKEELFDKKIKEMLDSCSEIPAPEVWDRIESGIGRMRVRAAWKRIAYVSAAAAVAACLALSVFLRPQHDAAGTPEMQLAEVEVPEAPAVGTSVRTDIYLETLPRLTAPATTSMSGKPADIAAPRPGTGAQPGLPSGTEAADPVAARSGGAPTIYDRTSGMDSYTALVRQSEEPVRKKRMRPSFSMSAGGNVSPTRATGNVDFSQPDYTWGSGASASYTGIVPVSEPAHHFPVSVGLELKYSFLNDRLGVGLGLNYTFLKSSYEALVDRQYQASVDQSVHYLGIPLNFYVNILSNDRLTFYAGAGGMLERAVRLSYSITDLYSVKYQQEKEARGVQWSANVGLGFEYRFLDFLGLYVDPRLTYFFDCGQPYSVRTEQPLQFSLQMGFRFHIGS